MQGSNVLQLQSNVVFSYGHATHYFLQTNMYKLLFTVALYIYIHAYTLIGKVCTFILCTVYAFTSPSSLWVQKAPSPPNRAAADNGGD